MARGGGEAVVTLVLLALWIVVALCAEEGNR